MLVELRLQETPFGVLTASVTVPVKLLRGFTVTVEVAALVLSGGRFPRAFSLC